MAALACATAGGSQESSSEHNDQPRRVSPVLQPASTSETTVESSARPHQDAEAAVPTPGESGEPQSETTDPIPLFRRPLLREDSYLTEATGRLIHDDQIGFWVFEADPEHIPTTVEHRVPLRFIMLPCAKLQQMQRTVESTEFETVFLLTGRITVFDDQNYVIPLDAPLIEQRQVAPPETLSEDEGDLNAPPAPDDAEELIQSIRREVPIARSLAPLDDDPDVADADMESLAPEGQLIVARRGRVVRNARGGWEFVFTADAAGLADPPMTLLPCLLLEQLQNTVAKRHAIDTILLTGEVYMYFGRNYLLPTTYQIEPFTGNVKR